MFQHISTFSQYDLRNHEAIYIYLDLDWHVRLNIRGYTVYIILTWIINLKISTQNIFITLPISIFIHNSCIIVNILEIRWFLL